MSQEPKPQALGGTCQPLGNSPRQGGEGVGAGSGQGRGRTAESRSSLRRSWPRSAARFRHGSSAPPWKRPSEIEAVRYGKRQSRQCQASAMACCVRSGRSTAERWMWPQMLSRHAWAWQQKDCLRSLPSSSWKPPCGSFGSRLQGC